MSFSDFIRRLSAFFVASIYLMASSPVFLFASGTDKQVSPDLLPNKVKFEEKTESRLIKASEGGVVSLGDASIYIPAGALDKDTEISITHLASVAETGESLYNAVPDFRGYRFLPAGTKFKKDAEIVLPYAKILDTRKQSLEELHTYFYDTSKSQWVPLERKYVDNKNHTVHSLTSHFTDMINATLTMPESADPIDINLNSIKNLEAAKPDSHVIKFNPPKADSFGDASFSFDLEIPHGRRGLQPGISVSYSSGGGNGIMGIGFDVRYGSAITTDTRFGLPDYDTENRYMLDGVLLEKTGSEGNDAFYKPRKETSFSRIIRKNARTDNDYWEVTSKDGTVRRYGMYVLTEESVKSAGDSCVGEGSQIFTWNITETTDIYGNSIVYEYTKDSENGGYVYPADIYYTGHGKTKGKYRIHFEYEKENRPDVRVEARSGKVIACERLLSGIVTSYWENNFKIRAYKFEYRNDISFSKASYLSKLTVEDSGASDSYEYTFEYEGYAEKDGKTVYFDGQRKLGDGRSIQLGSSTTRGVNFNASAGVGVGTSFADGRATVGGSGSVSSGTSRTDSSMVDINGDGMADFIWQDEGELYCSLNEGMDKVSGTPSFSKSVKLTFKGGSLSYDMNEDDSSTSTYGWNIYGGAGLKSDVVKATLGAAYSKVNQRTTSNSRFSFSDMDRDGLVDIVESGRQTYFRNNGNLTFTATPVYSTVVVTDIKQSLEADEIEEYRKTYFVQTPFRAWKAPYNGTIEISETACGVENAFSSQADVSALTFIGSKDTCDNALSFKVPGAASRSGIKISRDKSIYFITNNGPEPRNTDLSWNVNIKYSTVRVFDRKGADSETGQFSAAKGYDGIYFFTGKFENYSEAAAKTINNSLSMEKSDEELLEEFRQKTVNKFIEEKLGGKENLLAMYKVSSDSTQEDDGATKLTVDIAYDSSWESLPFNKKAWIYEGLIELDEFLPTEFTRAELQDYYRNVFGGDESETVITDKDEIERRNAFASKFLHYTADDRYILETFEDEDSAREFLSEYPLSREAKKAVLEKYSINSLPVKFDADGPVYFYETSVNADDGMRGEDKKGTLYASNGSDSQYVYVFDYTGNQDSSKTPVVLGLSDGKVLAGGVETEALYVEDYEISSDDDSCFIKLKSNFTDTENYEAEISVLLSGIDYRALAVSPGEYEKIVSAIEIPYCDISGWQKNWDADSISMRFEETSLTEEELNEFIPLMYTIRTEYKKDEQGKDTTEIDSQIYVFSAGAEELKRAAQILENYRYREAEKIAQEFFDSGEDKYLLKDLWTEPRSEDYIRSLYKDDTGLPETASSSEIKEYLTQKWKWYTDRDKQLLTLCKSNHIGKYRKISCQISYNKNYEYPVIYSDKKNEASYPFLRLSVSGDFERTSVPLTKAAWDSSTDFSTEDITASPVLCKYITEEEVDCSVATGEETEAKKETVTVEGEISVPNNEILYGGTSRWYYGVWKGALDDSPFSEVRLTSFMSEAGKLKENGDLEKLKSEKTNINTSNPEKNADSEEEIHFYLPQKNAAVNSSGEVNGFVLPVGRNDDISVKYDVDLETALIGTVATRTEQKKDGSADTYYYMPFVSKDIIHCDRAGGSAYYNIEGIDVEKDVSETAEVLSSASPLSLPTLRRTFTEGTDITPSISAGVSVEGEIAESDYVSKVSGALDLSGSYGTNNSTSETRQLLTDMNGDGIPDIVQCTDGRIVVTSGSKIDETGIVSYTKNMDSGITGVLSKNVSEVKTYGGSVSATGTVTIKPKGKNNSLELNASATPSSGVTYSTGDSTQDTGLLDINGDGLPDYYSSRSFRLNTGNGFVSSGSRYSDCGDLTSTTQVSLGRNSSAGKGADLSEAKSLSSGVSTNIGISYGASSSNTERMLLDVNGDGLQDIVSMKPGDSSLEVRFNKGDGFGSSLNVPVDKWNVSVTEGVSFIRQDLERGFDFGFVSELPVIGNAVGKAAATVTINPFGFGFDVYINSLEWNTSVSLGASGSAGVNVNISIPVWLLKINVTVSEGAGVNMNTSLEGVSVRMLDVDGDGLSDHVLRIPNVGTYYKRNLMGRVGLLRSVRLPQGGKCEIDYAAKYGTTANPNFKYVMSSVTMSDGCGEVLPELSHGEHSVTTRYSYSGGYYDRQEKDFYGFRTVRSVFADGTYSEDEYYNDAYYSKGITKNSVVYSSNGEKLSENHIVLDESPNALVKFEENFNYELSSPSEFAYTSNTYNYDEFGNVIELVQKFDDKASGERLSARIDYDTSDIVNYIVSLPLEIFVYDKNQNLIRRRAGRYDTKGSLVELRQYFDNYSCSVHIFTYDGWGNITSVRDPRGATVAYGYDGEVCQFIEEISQYGLNTETYTGRAKYEYKTQTKEWEEDCNGNRIDYLYDKWQRPISIKTSYDSDSCPAVSYEYSCPNRNESGKHGLWYAVTSNKVTFDKNDSSVMKTVVQVDGVGRAVRTAKSGLVYKPEFGGKVEGWNVSGAVEYDNKGRAIVESMTDFVAGGLESLLESSPRVGEYYNKYTYDEKDRKIKTVLPDGSVQTESFYIRDGNSISESCDPLGRITRQKSDSRGNILEVMKLDNDMAKTVLTTVSYEYNSIGEMTAAYDSKKNPITVEYDLLGRKTALCSLDSGRQEFEYDECSNLIRETNSVLRETGKQICYEYDGLNRLLKVDYPDTADTEYIYGTNSDKIIHAAGKVLSVTDSGGTVSYEYGSLGEVTKETRTLATHLNAGNGNQTAVMEYKSDYLGRMQYIVYPDGEKIVYGYDEGGQVVSVVGEHFGEKFKYVNDIGYDEYGQRIYIEYGNGVRTDYNYNKERRWLDTINTKNKWGVVLQNISYSFDRVGNVSGYTNVCTGEINGSYSTKQNYSYDGLYQLTLAEGETVYNPYKSVNPEFKSTYRQEFSFDQYGLGNMTAKKSSEVVTPNKKIGDDLNYNFDYVYDDNFAHRLVSIGNRYYKYDSNGNVTVEQDGSFDEETSSYIRTVETDERGVKSTDYGWGLFKDTKSASESERYKRVYTWDEKNRLIASADSSYTVSYVYSESGERTNKYTLSSETLYFNKMWTLHTDAGNATEGGQTSKHIYLGETRIVTKLNSGKNPTYSEEFNRQYYYHADHLGSAHLITDKDGNEYQRLEYTPYGEIWVDKTSNTGLQYLPYKFTGKEMDEETGLYYYGARYLDPKYSRWLSTDPALGDYIPQAPINDEARRNNANLPGMGGVFNHINGNLYHYAGNNPVKYTDPDGRMDTDEIGTFIDLVKKLANANEDNRNKVATDLSNFMNENPDMWAAVVGAGAVGGTSYLIYSKSDIVKSVVDNKIATIKKELSSFEDRFSSAGINIKEQSYTSNITKNYNVVVKKNSNNIVISNQFTKNCGKAKLSLTSDVKLFKTFETNSNEARLGAELRIDFNVKLKL
ncbi:toxin TcdB middle/N-terminal domain-containing protein [Treponema sp.]|uniref:toxin TcdB middle/N-terminal domain-containing protein n=1 Tax=Treponema sp. TaxID=166 RepID=UPI00388D6082